MAAVDNTENQTKSTSAKRSDLRERAATAVTRRPHEQPKDQPRLSTTMQEMDQRVIIVLPG